MDVKFIDWSNTDGTIPPTGPVVALLREGSLVAADADDLVWGIFGNEGDILAYAEVAFL